MDESDHHSSSIFSTVHFSHCIYSLFTLVSPLIYPSINMSTNSNDAKRDAQEGTNRLSEDVQHAGNSMKRAVFGGSAAGDNMQEAQTHQSNRVGEVANRVGDKISEVATNIAHPGTSAK